MPRIYVASSWRNKYQPEVVAALRKAGHEVYDFRNPKDNPGGFHWSDVDENWQEWQPEEYIRNLTHPVAEKGFKADLDAMIWADTCVLVLPCGRSAHTEAGWMAGAGMNWHPVENLRLHALAAYNELWDCTSVSVGATYYLNFGK